MNNKSIKRFLAVLLLTIIMMLSFAGCDKKQMLKEEDISKNNNTTYSMFILLEDNNSIGYRIVYHKDTKVMYAISCGYYNCGTFTVMLNADGTPMIYSGN